MVDLSGHRAYLDASTIIYAIEVPSFQNLRNGLLKRLDDKQLVVVTSELALWETLIGPRKSGNTNVERLFRAFLTPSSHMIVEPITRQILEKAVDVRVQFGLKTPDAIHLATGLLTSCDMFITGDAAWARAGVQIVDPAEIG